VVGWEEVVHVFLTTEVELLFKWRLKGLRLVEGVEGVEEVEEVEGVEGVEVEDPESAKHESGGVKRLKGLK